MLKKTLRLLLLAALLMPLAAKAQETVTIGDGTSASYYTPIATYWNYSFSEQLYTATEINQTGTISSIAFEYATSTAKDFPIKVYMKAVENENLTSAWVSLSESDLVYEGTLSVKASGWQTIELNSPFDYDGTSNLLIAIDKDYVYWYMDNTWKYTSATGMARFYANDSNNPSIDNLTTYTGQATNYRPNIKLEITPSGGATCEKPETFEYSDVTSNSAKLTWSGGSGTYNVEYKKASADEWTPALTGTTLLTTTLTLEPATDYQARVQSVCDGDPATSSWKSVSFPTDCAIYSISTESYSYDFEDAGKFKCWEVINGNITIQNGSYPHSGTKYLDFRGTTSNMIALPGFEQATNTLRLVFWTRPESNSASNSGKFAVGYMTDLEDASTFVPVATYNSTSWSSSPSYEKKTVDFDVTGVPANAYIAMRQYDCATYYYWFVDDVEVMQVPDCAIPAAPVVIEDSETPEGATIAWTPGGDETSWTVQYKKTVETEWTTIETPVTDTTYTFTELSSTTTYQARIIAACTGVTYPSDAVNFTTIDPCQAPKNFKATNITHNSATLSWTKGYAETAWTVKYVKASGDWEDADVVNVENTPTANLTDLEENTTYNVRIAGCNPDIYLYANFKTKDPNAAPTNLVWTVTQTTATLSWTPGYTTQTEWTVEYKKSSDTDYTSMAANDTIVTIDELEGFTTYNVRIYYVEANKLTGSFTTATKTRFLETFSTTSVPTGWARYYGKMSEVLSGKANLSTTSYGWDFSTYNNVFVGGYHAYCTSNNYWLVTPNIELTEDIDLNFDLAFTAYSGDNVTPTSYGDNDTIAVLITADNGATWTPLKVWDNNAATSNAKLSSLSNGADKDTYTQLSLSAYDNQTVKIAFYYKAYSTESNRMHIDNIDVDEHQDCRTPVLTLGNYLYDRANFSWTNSTGCTWTINYKQHDAEEWTPINNLPTNQYQITGLTAETKYDVRVKASCNKYWSNTVTFTTRNECPTPQNLAANNITHASTNLTWDGWSDSYTVEYRTAEAAGDVLLEEYFDDFDNLDEVIEAGWTIMGLGTSNWSLSNTSNAGGDPYEMDLYYNPSFNGTSRLVTPALDLTDISSVMFTFKHSLDIYSSSHTLGIATSSDNGDTWHSGWSKTYSSDITEQINEVIETEDMGKEEVLFCIYYTGYSYNINDWYFDDIVISTSEPAGEWEEATATATAGAYTLGGLDAGTAYDVRVRANCDTEEWCEASFTTYDDDTKIFITSGSWFKASNWDPQIVPDEDNNVIIRAAANILDEAAARHITIEEGGSITIGDGGTLYHRNTGVVATVEKEIAGHGGESGSWNLISTSLGNTIYNSDFPTNAVNLIATEAEDYDLYSFSGGADEEWRNYKASSFSLYYGKGYLYANSDDVTLQFKGTLYPAYNGAYLANNGNTLTYETSRPLGTVTLIGNMFAYPAYIAYVHYNYGYQMDSICQEFYVMNDDGDEIVVSEENILMPNQGAFIEATSSSQYVAATTYDPFEEEMRGGSLSIRLGEGRRKVDMAKVRFGEGRGLTKFQLNENHTKLYIPQGNTDYAVAFNAEAEGEMPLNFRPEKTGQYTITIDAKDMEFSYLHLIDNITGANVDLLTDPSYTFIGSVRDDVNRFRIVFSSIDSNIDVESEVFAYQNGDDIVVSGEGLVQIYDVMGRYVTSFEVNGTRRISAYDYQNAVYIFRLVGNEVKTQKIVVR